MFFLMDLVSLCLERKKLEEEDPRDERSRYDEAEE